VANISADGGEIPECWTFTSQMLEIHVTQVEGDEFSMAMRPAPAYCLVPISNFMRFEEALIG
jgi:hypothetical protein